MAFKCDATIKGHLDFYKGTGVASPIALSSPIANSTQLPAQSSKANTECTTNNQFTEFSHKEFNAFWLKANKAIRASGAINAEGCKIEIPTQWNLPLFEEMLKGYHDSEILCFLKYGWPISADNIEINTNIPPNQKGARDNPCKLRSYIEEELRRNSIVGPFDKNPLGMEARFSPLDAIPKKDSVDLRVILNLSYPPEAGSVNQAIDKDKFLNRAISLKYPGVEDLIKLIRKKGWGCLLFKTDLKKFYRQIFMDPGNIHFLGFVVDGKFYFDTVLSMGLRIACYIGQRISNALMFIYKRLSYEGINYLDDLGSAEIKRRAKEAFLALKGLLSDLNIQEAEDKACLPSPIMTFLGISYNTEEFTISLTEARKNELCDLLSKWLLKEEASLREVQSLLGKLNFACSTVRAGRVFLGRLINFLCEFNNNSLVVKEIPQEAKADISWWHEYMIQFDGISLLHETRWRHPDAKISSDSSLSACGGYSEGEYFHAPFLHHLLTNPELHINELECLAVVVAVKLWAHKYKGMNLLLHCDNSSTVSVINKGKANHPFTQACLRELVWTSGKNDIWIKVVHVAGITNRFADLCSRFNLGTWYRRTFNLETAGINTTERFVPQLFFSFINDF